MNSTRKSLSRFTVPLLPEPQFFAELRGGGRSAQKKGLAMSCFAPRAAAKPDLINPMGFEGLGVERVFRAAGAF